MFSSMLFVLVVYTDIVMEPSIVSDRMKAFLDDPEQLEHIRDPQLNQIKRQTSSNL